MTRTKKDNPDFKMKVVVAADAATLHKIIGDYLKGKGLENIVHPNEDILPRAIFLAEKINDVPGDGKRQ